jgi:hypothetical protein
MATAADRIMSALTIRSGLLRPPAGPAIADRSTARSGGKERIARIESLMLRSKRSSAKTVYPLPMILSKPGRRLRPIRSGSSALPGGASFGDHHLPPRRHALPHAVAADQSVEECGPEMDEERGEQQVGEIGVQVSQPRIEYLVMR